MTKDIKLTKADPAVAMKAIRKLMANHKKATEDKRTEIEKAMERFEKCTLSTIEAYQHNPEDDIAGEGFLKKGGGTLLTGGTGVGKSVMVQQWCFELAAGQPLIGCIPVKRPYKVLYLQAENDMKILKKNMTGIMSHVEHDRETVEKNLSIYHSYGIYGETFIEWLEAIVEYENPEIIVIDPYQSFIDGGNINDSGPALSWLKGIDNIIVKRRIGLLLSCHTPKPTDRDKWNVLQNAYMSAGSSVLPNWCRSSCELLIIGQETDRFKLTFGKNAEDNGLCDDKYGGIVRELYVAHSRDRRLPYWVVADDQTTASKDTPQKAKIKEAIKENPELTKNLIAIKAGLSRTTVYKYWDEIQEEIKNGDDKPREQPKIIGKVWEDVPF